MSRDFELGTNVSCDESTVSPRTGLIYYVFVCNAVRPHRLHAVHKMRRLRPIATDVARSVYVSVRRAVLLWSYN